MFLFIRDYYYNLICFIYVLLFISGIFCLIAYLRIFCFDLIIKINIIFLFFIFLILENRYFNLYYNFNIWFYVNTFILLFYFILLLYFFIYINYFNINKSIRKF